MGDRKKRLRVGRKEGRDAGSISGRREEKKKKRRDRGQERIMGGYVKREGVEKERKKGKERKKYRKE